MRRPGRWRLRGTAGVMTVALVTGGSGFASASSAAPKAPGQAGRASSVAATAPVSPNPASGTPHLLKKTSPENMIRQIVQCGNVMYAVGRFSKIIWNGTT